MVYKITKKQEEPKPKISNREPVAPEGVRQGPASGWRNKFRVKPGYLKFVFIAAVVVVVGVVMYMSYGTLSVDRYSAVHLDGGDVYFGKIDDVGEKYVTLSDVYYFNNSDILRGSAADNVGKNYSLLKRGGEIHSPDGTMQISSSHVMFTENLGPKSKVLDAILKYKSR